MENEHPLNEGIILCDPVPKIATRVMSLREWVLRAYSNYTLFEWAPMQTGSVDRPAAPTYLYLRGRAQVTMVDYNENISIGDLFNTTTNRPVNTSAPRTAHNTGGNSFDDEDEESCENGIVRII